MEVHMGGIPPFLSAERLKTQLETTMAALHIPAHAFSCEKYRNAKWANVTFLHPSQGEAFMHKHGQQEITVSDGRHGRQASTASSTRNQVYGSVNGSVYGPVNGSVAGSRSAYPSSNATSRNPGPPRTRKKPRLKLMGNEIFCSLSKPHGDAGNPVAGQPNPITLKGLKYAQEEKVRPTRQFEKEALPRVFEIVSLACGQNVFVSGKLVFVPEAEWDFLGIAKFSKSTLLIKLRNGYIIRIATNTMVNLVCTYDRLLTLTLSEVPAFFRETNPGSDDVNALISKLTNMTLGSGVSKDAARTRVSSLDDKHSTIQGQCLVYQLRVSGTDLPRQMNALSHHEGLPFMRFPLMTQRIPPVTLGFTKQAMPSLMDEISKCSQDASLPFGILFQLQSLAQNAYLHPGIVLHLTKELRRIYKSDRDSGKRAISADALKMLRTQCSYPMPHGDPSHFEVQPIIDLLRSNEKKFRDELAFRESSFEHRQSKAYIHRVTVTPSRITLHGPELEQNNRILRKFPNHHDFFCRVQFCDENGQDMFFNTKISYDEIWHRFKTQLSKGIQIGGRLFGFLGFSHSSLRSHSAWFSAPFMDDNQELQTYFSIIRALGYFSQIRSPAKCAARIGQAFSETPFSLSLEDHGIQVEKIKDVTSADGTRTFSDGVGTLSLDVVHDIWNVIPQSKAAPTAFQIRFRGAKGMLALDSRLRGSVVRIRPSMTKFESADQGILEICDMASKPIPLVLNRQMIKLLEDMGSDPQWFLNMQSIEIQRLREVTSNPFNVANFMKHKNVGEGIRFHRLFRRAANMGIDWRKEPFLRAAVESMVLRDLRLLKHKARIPIAEGMTLFGILDETGFLREGEVYATYDSTRSGGRYEPPPGHRQRVIVTRSPALHPGDIQLPLNVVPPQGHPLRSLSNVIVFSRKGQRDLPSMLSGGDLDGDIYNVIWDARAMPETSFPPADYPRGAAIDLGRLVEKEDMANFFIDFIKQDCLGVIATRHMILADQKEEGSLHADCQKLAQLHSTAVDFSKTGISVELKELPKANKYRPDFLAPGPECRIVDKAVIELNDYIIEPHPDEDEDQFAGARYEYYASDKILGHLYRAIDERKIWKDDVQSKVKPVGPSFWDEFILGVRPRYETITGSANGWTEYMETAREIQGTYEESIFGAMMQYSEHPIKPITELEVFIGNILNRSGVQTNRQRDASLKLGEEFDRISSWVTKLMRRVSHNPDAPPTGYQTQYDSLHLCLACVFAGGKVDGNTDTWRKGSEYLDMQSFRVVAACALLSELSACDVGRNGGGYVGVAGGH